MIDKITDNILFYPGIYRDSNTIIIMDKDDYLIIDVGTGNNISQLLDQLKELKIDFEKARYYFTHSHCDHIGGFAYITRKAKGDLTSYLHKEEFELINSGDLKHMYCSFYGIDFEDTEISNSIQDGDIIQVGNIKLQVIHTPGHTIGSTVLYDEKDKVLISGDTVFSDGSVGRWDFITGNKEMLEDSLIKLSELDVKIILPGHMAPALHNGNEIIEQAYKRFFY